VASPIISVAPSSGAISSTLVHGAAKRDGARCVAVAISSAACAVQQYIVEGVLKTAADCAKVLKPD
jgi:hypothetical protein